MSITTKLRHYYGAYRLTLSGDVSISSGSPTVLYELIGEKRDQVQQIIQELAEEYPFLKVAIKDGISESEISFFSYDAAMADDAFLEHFRGWLQRFSECVSENGKNVVTINFSGVICKVCQQQKFRILNKGMDIQYKITGTDKVSLTSGVTHSQYFRYFETILLIVILLYISYSSAGETTPGKLV